VSVALAQRPKFRKSATLLPRILSAVILIPLALGIIYIGPPYSLVLGGIISAGLFIEWTILCLKIFLPPWSKLLIVVLGTAYMIVATLWLLHLLFQPEGWKLLYWLLFLVWSTDTASYVGGRLLKGPKLAPSISPYKTWAGFFMGIFGGTVVAYIASFWLLPNVFNVWEIIFLILMAQIGDLLESKIKRLSGVKDSSFLIPGHGGLLDRLDSLLAVAVTIALWQWLC